MSPVHGNLQVGAGVMTDTDLVALARSYKRNVATRFKLLGEGDIRHIQSSELFASVKLDGQLHFLYRSGDECFLFNANGRVVTGLALLDEAEQALQAVDSILLAGELYYQGDTHRSRVYHVTSALGSGGGGMAGQLAFAVFDILAFNGEPCARNGFKENQALIQRHLPDAGLFHRVEQQALDNKGLSAIYDEWVRKAEQEGVVAVAADTHVIYKIKPRHSIRAVIVGYTERPDEPGAVRVLLTALMRPDGTLQLLARAGTGFDDEQRRELFERLSPLAVSSQYKEADRNHTLFTMVRPELVIELAFHDLIMESGTGKAQMKAVLTYDDRAGYGVCLPEAFVSLLGPLFKCTLDDLTATPETLALTQLHDYVDLSNLESGARHLHLSKSEILQREVYTKTTKGLTSVRKFICWKSNKDEIDESYPAYAFCFVDYSPGRKAPLKRVVRVAHSPDAIQQIFDRFKATEIKRGWSVV